MAGSTTCLSATCSSPFSEPMAMPPWPEFLCHILVAPRARDLGHYALRELEHRRTPA